MGIGNFLGGVADQRNETDKLDLQKQTLQANQQSKLIETVDQNVAATMKIASEVIQGGLKAGKTPDQLKKAIAPLVADIGDLYSRTGRDPKRIQNQIDAMLSVPPEQKDAQTDLGKLNADFAAGRISADDVAAAKNKLLQTSSNPIENIKAKMARGETLTPAEQSTYDQSRAIDPEKIVTAENTLRDDYLKQSTGFQTIRDSWSKMNNLDYTDKEAGASDVALLYTFMKILDPGSTVREGEVALAQQASGVPANWLNLYNKTVEGKILTPELRNSIRKQADSLYVAASSQQKKVDENFKGVAKRQGLNPENVVLDLSPPEKKKAVVSGAPAPPPGFVVGP